MEFNFSRPIMETQIKNQKRYWKLTKMD